MQYYWWALLFFTPFANANCTLSLNAELIHAGAKLSTQVQYDFGRNSGPATCYLEAWPTDLKTLSALVKTAYQLHLPIRTQGSAHSLHGHALPQGAELLIHTTKLNRIAFNRIGTVFVEAGVPIRWLQLNVNANTSFILPIANGGGIAPSVGGYVAAGGISPDSARYGGFWEHVSAITLVVRDGRILTVTEKDRLFPWLFGSQGELGIIANVTLKLLRDEQKPFNYPLGFKLKSKLGTSNGYTWKQNTTDNSLFWFNVLATKKEAAAVTIKLTQLMHEYPHALSYQPIYVWPIRRLTFIPPLLSSQDEHLIALGLWGEKGTSAQQFNALKIQFSAWVNAQHLSHYGQVEPFAHYALNENTYQTFLHYKKHLDPKQLFNQASLFNSR